MDNEGHKSQQDVVGEVKVHPWEEKPEVVVPTSESERAEHAKINDLEKKKARRQKRQARKAKFFGFVKGHKKAVVLSTIGIVLLVAGGITAAVLLNQSKSEEEKNKWQPQSPFPADMTIEKAPTPEYAFEFMQSTFYKTVTRDVVPSGSSTTDILKIEDQANEFINSVESEYEKFFYRVYLPVIIGGRGDIERAKELMEELKPEKMVLDKKQRYTYFETMRVYSLIIGDEEMAKYYDNKLMEEYPPDYRG